MSDLNTIKNRLEKNLKHKKKWATRENIQAFRLYDRDIPDFPYIVDLYDNQVVVFEKTDDEIDKYKAHHFDYLIESLITLLGVNEDKIILKARHSRKDGQYEKFETKNELIIVNEHQAKFYVNLHDYIDTGLFLDHRPLRQIIYKEAKDKKVLNLFSYTGSISVFAALGGAKSVTSVDMSNTYMDWAKKNFQLNNIALGNHSFFVENALEYLSKTVNKFDLIILDPPTYSNSKSMRDDFDVERDQGFLVDHCMRILNENGVLYFSNNRRKFKLDNMLQENFNISNITARTIPMDFHDQKIHHTFKITAKK